MTPPEFERLIKVLAVYVVERGMPIKTALTILHESKHPKPSAANLERSGGNAAADKHPHLQLAI
jgi:hypothetical protein